MNFRGLGRCVLLVWVHGFIVTLCTGINDQSKSSSVRSSSNPVPSSSSSISSSSSFSWMTSVWGTGCRGTFPRDVKITFPSQEHEATYWCTLVISYKWFSYTNGLNDKGWKGYRGQIVISIQNVFSVRVKYRQPRSVYYWSGSVLYLPGLQSMCF